MAKKSPQPKTFRKKAPQHFQDLVNQAEELLDSYRKKYPQLKIEDSFSLPEEIAEDEVVKLGDRNLEEMGLAKQYFEAIWQVAWKSLFYLYPSFRQKNLTYDRKTKFVTELVVGTEIENPVPLKDQPAKGAL